MANQDWKSITITFVVAALILHYFLAAPVENKSFQISKNHIKYHANWTSHFSQLQHVSQLQEAYKLDNIESIDIAFSMSNLDLESIRKVFPTQFKQYKKIKINLANNPIGTLGADYILSLIPNQVEDLQVAFDSIDADLQLGSTIVKRLNNLNSLKRLKLSLILAAKNDTVIDDYFRFGRIGERLQSYSLVFIGNSLTSKSVGYLETHLSRANLKNLELNFYANKLGVEGAQIVSKAIKTQKNLQSLAVDFYFNNITDVGTKAISQAIEEINHPNLKSLLLNLDFNYIQNEGGKHLGTLLLRLTNIESLHLGVASKNFGYLGFKSLVNGLSQLTQLKQLNFRCGVNRVGDGGAEITRDLLFKLKNLVFLNLNFYQNYVGDQGVVDIIQGVASLQQLEKLSLNLGFSDAKGYGIIKGLEILAKKTFKQLYLGFSSNEIKDSEVNLVLDELTRIIKNNKVFEFEFMETAISKKQQKKLEKLFESGKLYKNKAVIHVNSVISEQQQKKYQQEAKAKAEQKPKETVNENKKAQETKKQQKVEKQRVVEKAADEVIELDGQQAKTISNQNKNSQQGTEQTVTVNVQREVAKEEQQHIQVKVEQPVEAKVQSPAQAKAEQLTQTKEEQTTEAESVEPVEVKKDKSIEVEALKPVAEKPAAPQAVEPVEEKQEKTVIESQNQVVLKSAAQTTNNSNDQVPAKTSQKSLEQIAEIAIVNEQATEQIKKPQATESVGKIAHESNQL